MNACDAMFFDHHEGGAFCVHNGNLMLNWYHKVKRKLLSRITADYHGWYEASADDVFVKLQGPFLVGKNIFSLRFSVVDLH